MTDRDFDIILLGATGFTGALTAEYLARHAPADCRWALAGRNHAKLESVRERLSEIDPACADLALLSADSTNADSLKALAQSARVVITTVGPYLQYGEPLVAACAEAGTAYVDLTGEPEFVDRMYLAYHEQAVASGARLVHCCGFDSIPHDLGVLYTVKQLPAGVPLTVRGVVRSVGAFSGGTFHSALGQFARARQMKQASDERRSTEPRPADRRARARSGKPTRDPVLGYYLIPLPTIDPVVVKRSAAARDDYGPDFTYSHFAGFKSLRYALGAAAAVPSLFLAAQVKPVRSLLLNRVPAGQGPDEAKRATSWFTVEFVGEGGGETVRTKVHGGDPGYTETATMLAESALCLAFDDNPAVVGQTTPAAAMGENLIERLQRAGISFSTVSDPG